MNNKLTLGEYISQIFFKETGQGKAELAINMGLTLEQVSLLLADKLELNTQDILRLSNILPISLAEIHSRLLLSEQRRATRPVGGRKHRDETTLERQITHSRLLLSEQRRKHRDETILERQITHSLNFTTRNIYLCDPLIILRMLNYDIKEAYSEFGHSISFCVFLKGHVVHITTQYSVKNSYSRANQFTSMFTPNRSSAEGLFIAISNEYVDFSEIAKSHNALNTFILDAYINRHKLHVDSLLHIFGNNRTKLNKFIEGNLKLDTSELIALQDTTSIPFELLKELQMRAGSKETLNDNKQQDMTMNKSSAVIKAFLDGMGNLLTDDQKKEIHAHIEKSVKDKMIHAHIEKSVKDKMIKDATETLGNAMKAMHLRLEEKAKMVAKVSPDYYLGYMNIRPDSSLTNIKGLVLVKRREEELVNAISKVKALIKKETIAINKLTDKRVNLTANLFNLEDKLTKLRNSSKTK